MAGTGDLGSRLDEAVRMIEQHLQPAAVLLYGSAAGGGVRADSDVDIAVLGSAVGVDAFDLASLRTDLEALLGRSVDLVVLDRASPILGMEVLRQHRVLALQEPARLEEFTVRTLREYFDLKRTRRPIEEAVRRTTVGS